MTGIASQPDGGSTTVAERTRVRPYEVSDPGSEWPEHIATPATFGLALREMIAMQEGVSIDG